MPTSTPETVAFDLDGTLIESRAGIDWSVAQAFAVTAPGLAVPELHIGPPIDVMLREAVPQAEPELLAELLRAFRAAYDSEGWRQTVVHDGVLPLLDRLREAGSVLHLVTNKRAHPTGLILAETGLAPYFASVSAGGGKAEHLRGFGPDAIYIGDDDGDRIAAEAAGVRFVGVTWGYGRFPSDCPVATSVDQLTDVLGLGPDER